jgi:hypothetical protein
MRIDASRFLLEARAGLVPAPVFKTGGRVLHGAAGGFDSHAFPPRHRERAARRPMHPILASLRDAQWDVTIARERSALPAHIVARHRMIDPAFVAFVTSFDRCVHPSKDGWFLSAADYAEDAPGPWPWDFAERMSLEAQPTPTEAAAIRAFWDRHLPFAFAVHSDYEYLAIRTDGDAVGAIVHGCAPEMEETTVVASSFEELATIICRGAHAISEHSVLGVFLHQRGRLT